jgi:predicted transcriptional regulator
MKSTDRFSLTEKGKQAVDPWGPEGDKPIAYTVTDKGRNAIAKEAIDTSKD